MSRCERRRRTCWFGLALVCLLLAPPAANAASSPTALRVDAMTAPLGIGDRSPQLSWKLPAGVQTAHQVQVASSAAALARGDADVWDSGKILSSRTSAAFGGPPLQSRRRVHWRVRSWIGAGGPTEWSEPSRWETGLLEPSDWTARWIGEKAWNDYLDTTAKPVTIDLPPQAARYVRLDVTKLGLPVPEGALGMVSRLQLAELELLDSTDANANRARAATVTASNPFVAGGWSLPGLVDGVLTTPGYTSLHSATQSVNPSFWVQLDLGAVRRFDKLVLFGRTDFTTADGRIPNFPVDFTLQTGTDAGALSTVKTVVGQQPPPKPPLPAGLPLFAKEFVAAKPVAEARLYATGLGVYEATVNGRPVGDAVLEPGNTDYADRVIAATYDVTPLIRSGENVIGARVGTGIYDTQTYGGRYAKFAERVGAPKLLAQLELTYADGTRETVGTGTDWKTTAGPTTFSNWFGGEDHDARREPVGWDAPGGERSDWSQAVPASPPSATTQVSARTGPPVEVSDRIAPVKITQPRPGIWVFDLGVNIAGWQELKVSGAAGTTITMRPAELLAADGTIDQGQTGSPIYDRYTLRGAGTETWRPHFVYHGFRYLQVEGLTSAPDAGTITGIVLRAANRSVGTFASSDATINGIHRIIDRAVQGNMFSVLTDCPHREKLGWLEETHLVFDTVARNYDVQAYGRDLVRNMADAQLASGLVPDIAPEYTVFSGGFRDDPNWGSAMILVPWNLYRTYGDRDTLRTYYANMVRYLSYLRSKASGNLLDYGLGDWATINTTTPAGVTASYGYYKSADALAKIAAVLGEAEDAATYRQLAADIGTAFNAKFFDAARHTYANGSQASDALALDMGIVPAGERQAVLDAIAARGYGATKPAG